MAKEYVVINQLTKNFGQLVAVDDLSFSVNTGEIFAFLGANGSGKTTTLRCLLGIYKADSGTATIGGENYTSQRSHLLGYLPEERGLYTSARVLETMQYFGQLKGMTGDAARRWSQKYLERVGLPDKGQEEIKKLSSGQQQKIQLGITIINNPPLLILDEPTKGLDPVNRTLLMEILLDLNKKGTTILFSTHQMEEAERIAHRLIMIKEGRRMLYGDIDDIKREFGSNIIHLVYRGKLPRNDKLYTAKAATNQAELTPRSKVTADRILNYLVNKGLTIKRFEISSPSLNDIFIEVMK